MGTFFFYLVMTLFIVMCLFMILLVLIQKGRGGGLSSAFGGAGGSTAFGSKTGDVLTWATSICFGVFLTLGITLNLMTNRSASANGTTVTTVPLATPAHTTTPAPKPAATPAPSTPSSAPGQPASPTK